MEFCENRSIIEAEGCGCDEARIHVYQRHAVQNTVHEIPGLAEEEHLKQIEALGVPVMEQAINAYRHITATDEFKEMERLRSRARHNEAAALRHARTEAAEAEREKWQGVVAEKDAENEQLRAQIAELQARLGG